jgi:hypothetical protein
MPFRRANGRYSACLWKKMIGKPYSGKPNVRFDEGELEMEPLGCYASSLLYWRQRVWCRFCGFEKSEN